MEQALTGIALQLLGFSDRLADVALVVAETITGIDFTRSGVLARKQKNLQNLALRSQACSQAVSALEDILLSPRWSMAELSKVASAQTSQD